MSRAPQFPATPVAWTFPISVIVPSLGRSAWQEEALEALRAELQAVDAELIWVHQGADHIPSLKGARERLLRLPEAVGFAAAANLGLGAARAESAAIAIVNDDLMVSPGWLAALAKELAGRPQAAAVQGVNLDLGDPERVEGSGLEWNRAWQAVQVGAGAAPPERSAPAFELFGVSATAALYRRQALAEVANGVASRPPGAAFFDERLGSYYEDVELAIRLREAGWESWCAPAARAHHAGQGTTRRLPLYRWSAIHRNRLLVLERLFGERFARLLPRLMWRDARDCARAAMRLDGLRGVAITLAWVEFSSRRLEFEFPASVRQRFALAAAERFRIGSAS